MSDFDRAFDLVIGHEGGYVNNPADSGGETKYGISKRAYPQLDIAALTLDQAKAIYRADFWARCSCDHLPEPLAILTFDAAVNSGPAAAIQALQRAIGVRDDGVVGPATLTAAGRADWQRAAARYCAERLDFYTRAPGWGDFGRGWVRRVAGNLREVI